MQQAIAAVEAGFGTEYPLHRLRGIKTEAKIKSINPSRTDQVGVTAPRPIRPGKKAMQQPGGSVWWQHVPAVERARYLVKAAAILRRRKVEFSANMF